MGPGAWGSAPFYNKVHLWPQLGGEGYLFPMAILLLFLDRLEVKELDPLLCLFNLVTDLLGLLLLFRDRLLANRISIIRNPGCLMPVLTMGQGGHSCATGSIIPSC